MEDKNTNKQNTEAATETAEPQPQQGRPCPKDCRKCSWQQQICCASLLSFQAFEVMNSIIQRVDAQSVKIAELAARVAAIQSSEAELSSPSLVQGNLFPTAD